MFEIIDTATTNVLTAMIYSVPVWMMLALLHFVLPHPIAQQTKPELLVPACKPEQPGEPTAEVAELLPMESESNSTPPIAAPVECAPVDWRLWRVADLRQKAVRGAFAIKSRQGSRMLKRRALIDQYERAMAT